MRARCVLLNEVRVRHAKNERTGDCQRGAEVTERLGQAQNPESVGARAGPAGPGRSGWMPVTHCRYADMILVGTTSVDPGVDRPGRVGTHRDVVRDRRESDRPNEAEVRSPGG